MCISESSIMSYTYILLKVRGVMGKLENAMEESARSCDETARLLLAEIS